jgi:hypothetical protein
MDSDKRMEIEMDIDEESAIALEHIKDPRSKEQVRKQEENASAATLAKTKSLRSIHSHRSYAASDGYTCFPEQDERPNISSGGTAEDAFLVQWDGDADPLNPRSMTKLRRWLIVLIISSSSLCV